MNYQLTGITKRSRFIYYHVCYIYPDGRTKYLEMRRERTDKEKLYLKCCRRTKCTATLSIKNLAVPITFCHQNDVRNKKKRNEMGKQLKNLIE